MRFNRILCVDVEWTELPSAADAVNLQFAAQAIGPSHVSRGVIVCRARNSYPLTDLVRALPAGEIV
jgi:hypothetical protein